MNTNVVFDHLVCNNELHGDVFAVIMCEKKQEALMLLNLSQGSLIMTANL